MLSNPQFVKYCKTDAQDIAATIMYESFIEDVVAAYLADMITDSTFLYRLNVAAENIHERHLRDERDEAKAVAGGAA